jgi:hypothetical protein
LVKAIRLEELGLPDKEILAALVATINPIMLLAVAAVRDVLAATQRMIRLLPAVLADRAS